MIIEEALRAHLISGTPSFSTRVYPKTLPQKPTLPAVVYHRISGPRDHSHTGPNGYAFPRFQIDVWASTFAAAKAAAGEVRTRLDGFQGLMGGAGGVTVDAVFSEDESDEYDDDLRLYMVSLDVVIHHQEA